MAAADSLVPVGESKGAAGQPASSVRASIGAIQPSRAMEVILQTSTIDLLHSYGVGTAPVSGVARADPPEEAPTRVVGLIPFFAPGFNGMLVLSLPAAILEATSHNPLSSRHALLDWARELVNQLMGRVKNRLVRFQVVPTIGLPTATTPDVAKHQVPRGGTQMQCRFRTLRGDIIVGLSGELDASRLRFSPELDTAEAGDVIMF